MIASALRLAIMLGVGVAYIIPTHRSSPVIVAVTLILAAAAVAEFAVRAIRHWRKPSHAHA